MKDSDASLTRTERRRRATHEDFLAAVRTLLVESGVTAVTARRAAKLADHASATFYSHFETVDDAIREAVAPTADWARCWADTIASSDDFAGAVADWIADFLVRIEVDGSEWEVVRAANRPLLTSKDFDEIAKRMVERHGDRFATRGVFQ